MNERIKELAIQSGANVRKFKYQSTISVAFDDESFEKFAELIVRECISISTNVGKNPYIPDGDQAKKIIRELKEHFGVEE